MSRKNTTATFVHLSDVYDYLELSNQEVEWIADKAWSNVSYGDANYTLIGNVFALDCMLELAEGKSRLNDKTEREGVVVRSLDNTISFKAISNKFLLSEK